MSQKHVTAAILVIGDEILSGRTKDKNIGYIADYMTNIGIDLREVRIVPDMSTYTRLPWLDRTASVICDLRQIDGSEWGGCTRTVLKKAIAAAAAQGIQVQAAFENEFYLATGTPADPVPYNNASCYSTAGLDRTAAVMGDMIDNLTAQGYVLEQAINEYGPGQLELVIKYTDALGAADQQLKFRDTIRGTAEVVPPTVRQVSIPTTLSAGEFSAIAGVTRWT